MIAVQTMMDEAAFPYMALWYRDLIVNHLGDDARRPVPAVVHRPCDAHERRADGRPRHGRHHPARKTRMINYIGVLQQALRDVAAWVEHGIAPPAEHRIRAGRRTGHAAADGRGASRRPSRSSTSPPNGGVRADVKVGDEVTFVASIVVPHERRHHRRHRVGLRGPRRLPAEVRLARRRVDPRRPDRHPHLRRTGHLLPGRACHVAPQRRPHHQARPHPEPRTRPRRGHRRLTRTNPTRTSTAAENNKPKHNRGNTT